MPGACGGPGQGNHVLPSSSMPRSHALQKTNHSHFPLFLQAPASSCLSHFHKPMSHVTCLSDFPPGGHSRTSPIRDLNSSWAGVLFGVLIFRLGFVCIISYRGVSEGKGFVGLSSSSSFFFFAGKQLRSADLNPHVVRDSKQDVWGYLVYTAGEGGPSSQNIHCEKQCPGAPGCLGSLHTSLPERQQV